MDRWIQKDADKIQRGGALLKYAIPYECYSHLLGLQIILISMR